MTRRAVLTWASWLDAIWDDEELKPNERVVAYVVARHTDMDGVALVTYDEIRRRSGIKSRDAVARALCSLADAGWLERTAQVSTYRLTAPRPDPTREARS